MLEVSFKSLFSESKCLHFRHTPTRPGNDVWNMMEPDGTCRLRWELHVSETCWNLFSELYWVLPADCVWVCLGCFSFQVVDGLLLRFHVFLLPPSMIDFPHEQHTSYCEIFHQDWRRRPELGYSSLSLKKLGCWDMLSAAILTASGPVFCFNATRDCCMTSQVNLVQSSQLRVSIRMPRESERKYMWTCKWKYHDVWE